MGSLSNYQFTSNSLISLPVTEFWKSIGICQSNGDKTTVATFFSGYGACYRVRYLTPIHTQFLCWSRSKLSKRESLGIIRAGFFKGQMPHLSPNRQCQSAENNITQCNGKINRWESPTDLVLSYSINWLDPGVCLYTPTIVLSYYSAWQPIFTLPSHRR